MNLKIQSGACSCQNVAVEVCLTRELSSYVLRECDCDFCQKEKALYLSDPNGDFKFSLLESNSLSSVRHGSESAEFLKCELCQQLIGVFYQEEKATFSAVNARLLADEVLEVMKWEVVSPKKLGVEEKVHRWKSVWFQSQFNWRKGNKNEI